MLALVGLRTVKYADLDALRREALPWKWEAVRNSRVAPSVEWWRSRALSHRDLLVELKGLAYKLSSRPKSFYDTCHYYSSQLAPPWSANRSRSAILVEFDRCAH